MMNDHSLPTVDEIRSDVALHNKHSTKQKWVWIGLAGFVCVFTLVIGLSVGMSNKNNSYSKNDNYKNDNSIGGDDEYDRYQASLELLSKHSDVADLKRSGSPQQQALNWMVNEDFEKIPTDHPLFVQRYALATLYYALGGPKWTKRCRWLGIGSECLWNDEEYMENQNILGGAACRDKDSPDEVTWLMLPTNRMEGTIPPELGLLTKLNFLLFIGNRIHGELPSSLEALTDVGYFDVGYNDIQGTLGSWIGGMTSLHTLDLANNRMQGEIPTEIGMCSNMLTMVMENNEFWGKIPTAMASMKALTNLRLGFNSLTGQIPSDIGVWGKKLKYLRLSDNKLEGKIPIGMSKLDKLKTLYLNDNKFTGKMAPQMSFLTNLEKLFLENNKFEDKITESFLQDLVHLKYFDVSNNLLQGEFPVHLLDHPRMEVLDVNNNDLGGGTDGFLPDGFPKSTSLKYLSMQHNFFEGTIPTTISNLEKLTHLDMSSNRLDGTMPSEIGLLTKLDYLFMADNDFEVHEGFPEWVRPLVKLRELSFKQNAILGEIPTWIGELSKLRLLDIDYNRITGQMPTEMGLLTEMRFLLLNRNWISGTIPTEFQKMKRLELLLLDDNHLNGTAIGTMCTGDGGTSLSLSSLKEFHSDCWGESLNFHYLECPCCTQCCTKNDEYQNMTCFDDSFLANYDGDWERNYDREAYYFSKDNTDLQFLPNGRRLDGVDF